MQSGRSGRGWCRELLSSRTPDTNIYRCVPHCRLHRRRRKPHHRRHRRPMILRQSSYLMGSRPSHCCRRRRCRRRRCRRRLTISLNGAAAGKERQLSSSPMSSNKAAGAMPECSYASLALEAKAPTRLMTLAIIPRPALRTLSEHTSCPDLARTDGPPLAGTWLRSRGRQPLSLLSSHCYVLLGTRAGQILRKWTRFSLEAAENETNFVT